MKCTFCEQTEVRLYQVCVGGQPLRMALHLCQLHGDRYLLRIGNVIGELLRDHGELPTPPEGVL